MMSFIFKGLSKIIIETTNLCSANLAFRRKPTLKWANEYINISGRMKINLEVRRGME